MNDQEEKEKLAKTISLINSQIDLNLNIIGEADKVINKSLDYYYNDNSYNKEISDKNTMIREIALSNTNKEHAIKNLDKLKQMNNSPYFARVDFHNEWGHNRYYFGISTLKDQENIEVHDWRTPIANLYYNGEMGHTSYIAPIGKIEGDVTLKRQYKFENGRLAFYVDNTSNISDQMLIKVLNEKNELLMKTIVNTIQKEQNEAIRYRDDDDLLILGVAGSGKTSIALHRVAYLMYKDVLKYENSKIALISPNEIFFNYISNVLPSLGENNIVNLTYNKIAELVLKKELEKIKLEPKEDYYERMINSQNIVYFASQEIFNKLNDFLCKKVNLLFNKNIKLSIGDKIIYGNDLFELFSSKYSSKSITTRKMLLNDYIESRVKEIKKTPSISKNLTELIKKFVNKLVPAPNYIDLCQEFINTLGLEDNIVVNGVLKYEYIYTLIYIKIYYKECNLFNHYNHLLIDEAQDLSFIEFQTINKLFLCHKTIVGDKNQMLIRDNDFALSSFLTTLLLHNSYRSSINIFNFLNRIIYNPNINALPRFTSDPKIIKLDSVDDEIEYLVQYIKKYKGNSLALICKTSTQAQKIYQLLTKKVSISLIIGNSTKRISEVVIGSVYILKGLEFEDVIIIDADNTNYQEKIDQNYLYTACSRAIQSLTLLYYKEISHYLQFGLKENQDG